MTVQWYQNITLAAIPACKFRRREAYLQTRVKERAREERVRESERENKRVEMELEIS